MNLILAAKRKISTQLRSIYFRHKAEGLGLNLVSENLLYYPNLPLRSIFDCGCSFGAELAKYMVHNLGSTVYCVDPTRKHSCALQALTDNDSRFNYIQCAVSLHDGELTFYEPCENESGSILSDHINAVSTKSVSYIVRSCSLSTLLNIANISCADYIKLDLEGAEYDLLSSCDENTLLAFSQIFVEFHHHCLSSFTINDTIRIVQRLDMVGFISFTVDHHNYLFVQKALIN
jgi:FkbM family methyltransferase